MHRYDPDILHIQRSIQYYDLNKCKLLADWLAERIHSMEIDKKQYRISIQQLRLSARATNVLLSNDIVTIGQLLNRAVNWQDICVLKGAGEKVLGEIQQKVNELRQIN
jgi:DNA-directed RNA polymerase alpha subunit